MIHPLAELAPEYESWVANCRPLPARVAEIDGVARGLIRPLALQKFGAVQARTKIPVAVQAVICHREYGESGARFDRNPGQGDPLTRPSVHVPKDRPALGAAPNDRFPVSWEFAADDAFTKCDRLDALSVPAWTLPYACWKWEGYNGFGPRAHGRRSSYVVGGTNLQQPGKYVADGVWDANHVDEQIGTLPIAMRMIELAPQLAFGDAVAIASLAIVQAPPVQPLPAALGGSLTGAKWVQESLNSILRPDPPLRVDGSYGRVTRAAVRRLQAEEGLPETGLVDDLLCNAIDRRLAAMRPVT